MTPAEQNLHDIVNSFARLPSVVRVPCPQCGARGLVPSSTWDRPQIHVERCTACSGKGWIAAEATP